MSLNIIENTLSFIPLILMEINTNNQQLTNENYCLLFENNTHRRIQNKNGEGNENTWGKGVCHVMMTNQSGSGVRP
jgi:hypothetical protein